VTTSEATKDGTYTLILGASGNDSNGDAKNASASVKLDIKTNGRAFAISGNLSSGLLAPGLTVPLELNLSNPNKKSLSVTNLSVTVQSVTPVGNNHCLKNDYLVTQYSGPYPLVVPGSSSTTLSRACGLNSMAADHVPGYSNQPGRVQGRHPVAVVLRLRYGQLT